ncbi:amidase [Granulicella tundricola]|uniref:Amidase n=1 Tax=Granulicella tundricola (strain ATCC BAA-1859 / DSM 23138 / MP5ACTX9) TaxID=1198114 RepID=E8X673_GRATM|nr:amidase [Granulicella tundricola]ADW70957.1 Amidase [Granulicella tundricola MP5ACTX9]
MIRLTSIRSLSAAALFLCTTPLLLATPPATKAQLDRDLLEATIPSLQSLYATHRYTVVQVTQWYLDRITQYDTRYKALIHVDTAAALATAASEDKAAAQAGKSFHPGPLWGIPMVIKSNTSIKGLITYDGWKDFQIPGKELVAPKDATVVTRLRAAGAILLAQTNMPDFAASDTNKSSAFGRTGNAYDARFSPGGSSGGTVTAVTANFALLGTGTDTANSIRMPSGTSAVVGILPTRGLVSIAGIAPLDWLRDNTGPIARDVTDAAIALGVMAGEDPQDFRTKASGTKAQPAPYTAYLKPDALKGKRLGVPAFIVAQSSTPTTSTMGQSRDSTLRPETRALFLKALDELRAAGATIVIADDLLPESFARMPVTTRPYLREGMDHFLRDYGPTQYHSIADFEKTTGSSIPGNIIGSNSPRQPAVTQRDLESDPEANATFFAPQQAMLAAYNEGLDRYHLDGYVYPALQMPPNDETIPQPDGRPSSGPHSNTGWVNKIGVPAIVVPSGFYASGLPTGIEFSTRPWHDGDLLGYAFAYEQFTHHREPPVLVTQPRPAEDQ